jgi:hypothetical protein
MTILILEFRLNTILNKIKNIPTNLVYAPFIIHSQNEEINLHDHHYRSYLIIINADKWHGLGKFVIKIKLENMFFKVIHNKEVHIYNPKDKASLLGLKAYIMAAFKEVPRKYHLQYLDEEND